MTTPWQPQVRHTRPGEAVKAGVDGRPTRDLERRTDHLKARADESGLATTLWLYNQPLESGLTVGDPVYYDREAGVYKKACTDFITDQSTGTIRAAETAEVRGLLAFKASDTLGDLVTFGPAQVDVSTQCGESPLGLYYLGSQPGTLARAGTGLGPAVLFADGDGTVFVNVNLRSFADAHTHHCFELACQPAGTASSSDGRVSITEVDGDRRGWLPIDHPSLSNKYPAGAVFGYNLAADPDLNALWPPTPAAQAVLIWDRADFFVNGGIQVPSGPGGLVVFDRNGLWWMSNCEGDTPFPLTGDTGSSSTSSEGSGSSESSQGSCPRVAEMAMTLYYIRHSFLTEQFAVTSLRGEGDIEVVGCQGTPALTGDLKIRLKSGYNVRDANDTSNQAIKTVDGLKLVRGPVVCGIAPHADGSIALTGDYFTENGVRYYYGKVTAQADLEPGEKLLLPTSARLDDIRLRYLNERIPYLGMPEGQASSLVLEIQVPSGSVPTNPRVKLRLLVFGSEAGDLPPLTLSYRKVERPADATGVLLPTSDTTLDIDAEITVSASRAYEIESDSLVVSAGDTIFLRLARAAGDDFSGEVGLLSYAGVLYPGPAS